MSNVVVASLVEFFTLKAAATQAARLDEPGRKRVIARATLAKQRADAAEALWAGGHPAEALRLLVDAFGKTQQACEAWLEATSGAAPNVAARPPAPTPETSGSSAGDAADENAADPSDAGKNGAGGSDAVTSEANKRDAETAMARFVRGGPMSARAVQRLVELEKELVSTTLPSLDAEVLPVHGELFDRITDTRVAVARALADATLVPRELTFRRIGRVATIAVTSLVAVLGGYFALRTPEGVHARASAHFNEMPDFEPSRVLDGNTETSWLLPDRTAGWVEVTINPARPVTRVRLLNTHNTPYNDRATLQYRLTVFAGGSEARAIDGAFEFSASPTWVTHDLGSIEGVDRVRFEARTWHQHGGGLAEIAIE